MENVPLVHHVFCGLAGSSGPCLVLASDGKKYVVKHAGTPFKEKLLVNELLATMLAREIGLPVRPTRPIRSMVPFRHFVPSAPCFKELPVGLHVGSEWPDASEKYGRPVYDYLPRSLHSELEDKGALAGAWLFDVWTGNADGTQMLFWREDRNGRFKTAKIDYGWCFGANEWVLRDLKRSTYRWECSAFATGSFSVNNFEPYFTRIQQLSRQRIVDLVATVPPSWLGGPEDQLGLERVIEQLVTRTKALNWHAEACWDRD